MENQLGKKLEEGLMSHLEYDIIIQALKSFDYNLVEGVFDREE